MIRVHVHEVATNIITTIRYEYTHNILYVHVLTLLGALKPGTPGIPRWLNERSWLVYEAL